MKRIAINGLGRIGRLVLRHYMEMQKDSLEIVAVNDLVPPEDLAYLLKYDSVHGRTLYETSYGDEYLQLDTQKIKLFAEKDPGTGGCGLSYSHKYGFRYCHNQSVAGAD